MTKPILKCYKCGTPYHYKIKRNWLLRNVLFFLPVKTFFCGKCVKKRYVMITDDELSKYKRV